MPSPLIVFDLDGTLADTGRDLVRTLNVILSREGVPPVAVETVRDLIGVGARPLIERGLSINSRSVAPERLEQLYQAFLAYYHDNIAVETVLFPGVEEALDRLEQRGWHFAVCTNKLESHALTLLDALCIAPRFRAIAGKDTFAFFKPDPRHLTETIRRAGGDTARAILVGDSKTDIDTARNADVPVVAVSFGYTAIPVRELEPDAVIDHFDAMDDAVARIAVRFSRKN